MGRFWHGSAPRHGSSCSQVLPGSHMLDGDVWANAGVLMLVRIGADQATAAPVPIRLSILRREISSELMNHPLRSSEPTGCPAVLKGHIMRSPGLSYAASDPKDNGHEDGDEQQAAGVDPEHGRLESSSPPRSSSGLPSCRLACETMRGTSVDRRSEPLGVLGPVRARRRLARVGVGERVIDPSMAT